MSVSHVSFDVNADPVGLHPYALFAQAEQSQRTLERTSQFVSLHELISTTIRLIYIKFRSDTGICHRHFPGNLILILIRPCYQERLYDKIRRNTRKYNVELH